VESPLWGYVFGPPKEKRAMVELLRSLPVFDGLSTNELLQIDRTLHERRYAAGEIVFDEGMPGAGLYIVHSGEVSIRKRIEDSGSIVLTVIRERSFFGEMALLDEMPRSAGAVADKNTVLLALCQPDLDKLRDRNPKLALKVISNISKLVCRRLVRTNEALEALQGKLNGLTAPDSVGG